MKRNTPFVLPAACLAAMGLLAAVWFLLGRGAFQGSRPAPQTAPATSSTDDALSEPAESPTPAGPAAVRDRVQAAAGTEPGAPTTDAASAAPATVVGSLRIDGELQEHGEVELRDASGSWSCAQALNYDGKFRFDDVPSGDLALSFEPAAGSPRQLFVARIDFVAAPGEVAELALELASTQVNVRVLLAAEPGWNQAHVEITAPGLTASVETDENGKCSLGLVGKGRFRFRATTRSGELGEAFVHLEGGEGLESVVISPQDAY